MKNIQINFNIGPIESSENTVGSFDFVVADPQDEKQIAKALKQSLKRLGIAKNQIIFGIIDIFQANKKIYEADIFRIGNINRSNLRRIE